MFALKHRNAADGVAHHVNVAPRVYSDCDTHRPRIERMHGLLQVAAGGREGLRIVELGCGTADISGPSASTNQVTGIECSARSAEVARQRFPDMHVLVSPLESVEPVACDILIICEVLEHLENPAALIRQWMPLAKQSIISHPLDEPEGSGLSAGEHQWSFSGEDFNKWFEMGHHDLIVREQFRMGGLMIIAGQGKLK